MRALAFGLTLAALCAATRASGAEPRTLRFATAAPDGTTWARELRAASRGVEQETHGAVRVKWYFGGIAGNELDVIDRIRRGQLDGATATVTCSRLAPSLRVSRIPGLFHSRSELHAALGMLRPTLEAEFHKAGLVNLVDGVLGPAIVLSRTPVASLEALKKIRMWRWDLDDGIALSRAVGLDVVPLPVEQAAKAYDEHRIDAFAALPSAALAFQWSAQARYFTNLVLDYLPLCFVMSRDSFEALDPEVRDIVRGAMAKADAHLEFASAEGDDLLVTMLFQQQGLQLVPVSKEFAAGFLEAAERAQASAAPGFVGAALLERVISFLADYRREHPR
jgi:TRAP-type C4-dicarboxylate transport system substrate-binding protein